MEIYILRGENCLYVKVIPRFRPATATFWFHVPPSKQMIFFSSGRYIHRNFLLHILFNDRFFLPHICLFHPAVERESGAATAWKREEFL